MFDLATAKTRLSIGAADASKDALINVALSTSLSIAELYCNRKFESASEQATFTHPDGHVLQLPRFPIETITSVEGDNNAALDYHVIRNTGQVIVHGDLHNRHVVTVRYVGGYRVLPDDILLALWSIFDTVFAMAGGAGTAVAGADRINSITIPDVGTIRYESGGAASGARPGGSSGVVPDIAAAILNLYRLEVC